MGTQRKVDRWPHGCGRESCDLCVDLEMVRALTPPPERTSSRHASVRRTGEHLAIPEGIARQDAAFDALDCY